MRTPSFEETDVSEQMHAAVPALFLATAIWLLILVCSFVGFVDTFEARSFSTLGHLRAPAADSDE